MGKRSKLMPLGIAVLMLPFLFTYNNCSATKTSTQDSTGIDSEGGGSGDDDQVIDRVEGKAYFESTIVPMFESDCMSCHNQPRFGGTAPLSIFVYGDMSALLHLGESSTDNELINIMQNISSHDGGNVCPQGITASPCKEVMAWRKAELPNDDGGGLGTITFLSLQGVGSGWAKDPNDDNNTVSVSIYANGPKESGDSIGTFQANETGVGGIYGGHYFSFTLPDNLKDGTTRSLYVYAQIDGEDVLLPSMPTTFEAYTPTAQGQTFFNNTIRPQLNCNSCHVWDYTTAYGVLLSPSPASGGSPTNNAWISTGLSGSHPGGNFCNGNTNSGVCGNIRTWWNLEFQ